MSSSCGSAVRPSMFDSDYVCMPRTHTHTHIHKYTHTHTLTHILTHSHTHTHTHTHQVGEIVLFKNEGHNVPIVHRIVKVPKSIVNAQFTQDLLTFPKKKKQVHQKHNGTQDMLTKGDNNPVCTFSKIFSTVALHSTCTRALTFENFFFYNAGR